MRKMTHDLILIKDQSNEASHRRSCHPHKQLATLPEEVHTYVVICSSKLSLAPEAWGTSENWNCNAPEYIAPPLSKKRQGLWSQFPQQNLPHQTHYEQITLIFKNQNN